MSSKHTPGPWEIARYKNYEGFSVWAKGFGCIAERWWPPEEKDVIEANAQLIAAAPDLADALEATLNRYVDFVNSGDGGSWDPETEDHVKQARAALKRAGRA